MAICISLQTTLILKQECLGEAEYDSNQEELGRLRRLYLFPIDIDVVSRDLSRSETEK